MKWISRLGAPANRDAVAEEKAYGDAVKKMEELALRQTDATPNAGAK